MLAKHSSNTNEHYTPENIIDLVYKVLGHISLDPASCDTANKTIRADRFFTSADDGLKQEWSAETVFCNPPGGKINNKSSQAIWFTKMIDEFTARRFWHGIFLGFSLELLQTVQTIEKYAHPLDYTYCIPSKRIQFYSPNRVQLCPTHSNIIVLFSRQQDMCCRFLDVFQSIGYVNSNLRL